MADQTIPPGYCGAIADELRRVADALDSIADVELPEPRLFQLNIQPGGTSDADVMDGIDVLSSALLGKQGSHETVSGGPWYVARGRRKQIDVSIYRGLSKPPDERDAELARLRAEVEKLRAERLGDDPIHFDEADGASACGLAAVTPHKASQNWAEVTCKTCYDEVPF